VTPIAVPVTRPSHDLAQYVGRYDHPAYGTLTVALYDEQLRFEFRHANLVLNHFHCDRFDTPDDGPEGVWSVSFRTRAKLPRAISSPSQYVRNFLIGLCMAGAYFFHSEAYERGMSASLVISQSTFSMGPP
jgi:Domain of unknown function (DUF3471)